MSEIKLELAELQDFKGMINSDIFKKFILDPMQAQMNDLKSAYDCESLKQLYAVKGKKQGLQVFFNLIENIETKIENKKLEDSDEA